MSDIRRLLDVGAAVPRRPFDADAVLDRSREIARRRGIATVAVLALVVPASVVGASLISRDVRSDRPLVAATYPGTSTVVAATGNTIPAPKVGDVVPAVLNDGSRVYVVRHAEGDVTVVEAVDTHVPWGLQKQIGWCRTSGGFEEVFHSSRWDDRGRYLYGPAPRDLTTYSASVDGDTIRVGARVEATGRSRGVSAGGAACSGLASYDTPAERALIANALFADQPVAAAPLVSLDDVVSKRVTGVVAVDGFVELRSRELVVCEKTRTGFQLPSPSCAEGGLRLPLAAGNQGREPSALVGPTRVLLNLRDGGSPLSSLDVVRLPTAAPARPQGSRRVAEMFDSAGDYPGLTWTRNGETVPPADPSGVEISAFTAPSHCDWESATLLNLGWPLGTRASRFEQSRSYVRDPEGVMDAAFKTAFRPRAALPADARPTGYRTAYVELWLAPSDQDDYAYLVNADDHSDAERWPRGFMGCS